MKLDMLYDAVLFDLDNTLYDYDAYWEWRLSWSLEQVALAYPHLDIAVLIAQAMHKRIYSAQFDAFLLGAGVADPAVRATALERYRVNTYEVLHLYPDAAHVLNVLRQQYQLGLITNGPVRTQQPKIRQFGLERWMHVLVISEEANLAKPDPAIFHLALQRLGVLPERALYVGDSLEHDLVGAHAAGIDFAWMNPHQRPLPPDMPLPVAGITCMNDLLELLAGGCR
jgi:putative hydrolase of the HAD superfamily